MGHAGVACPACIVGAHVHQKDDAGDGGYCSRGEIPGLTPGARSIGTRSIGTRSIGARSIGARSIGARGIAARGIAARGIAARGIRISHGLGVFEPKEKEIARVASGGDLLRDSLAGASGLFDSLPQFFDSLPQFTACPRGQSDRRCGRCSPIRCRTS
jgi:hypothetical protein